MLCITLNALLALPYEEEEDEGPPPSLEAMHQKAQQMAAQHNGGQVAPTRGIEELDELIRKKEEEIKKGPLFILPNPGDSPRKFDVDTIDKTIETFSRTSMLSPAIRLLNEEERQQIYLSPDFRTFMDRSCRIMERALTEDVDIFTDYTGAGEETEA